MAADIILSVIFGILSGCGVGGGGLLVIYLTLAKDIGQLNAQGINLLFFVFSAAASLCVHLRKRRINYAAVGALCASGTAGAFFGNQAASALSPVILRKLFGAMLIISGAVTLIKLASEKKKARKY